MIFDAITTLSRTLIHAAKDTFDLIRAVIATRNNPYDDSLSNTFLIDAVKRENQRQVELALEFGANPNFAKQYHFFSRGYTTEGALYLAAGTGHVGITRLIASRSNQINKKDGYYCKTTTPIEHALSEGHKEAAYMLFSEFGASINTSSICVKLKQPICTIDPNVKVVRRHLNREKLMQLFKAMKKRKLRESKITFLAGAFDKHSEKYCTTAEKKNAPLCFVFGQGEISEPKLTREIFEFLDEGERLASKSSHSQHNHRA